MAGASTNNPYIEKEIKNVTTGLNGMSVKKKTCIYWFLFFFVRVIIVFVFSYLYILTGKVISWASISNNFQLIALRCNSEINFVFHITLLKFCLPLWTSNFRHSNFGWSSSFSVRGAQGPPVCWNGPDWRALVKDYPELEKVIFLSTLNFGGGRFCGKIAYIYMYIYIYIYI